jgi:hypothetical protein
MSSTSVSSACFKTGDRSIFSQREIVDESNPGAPGELPRAEVAGGQALDGPHALGSRQLATVQVLRDVQQERAVGGSQLDRAGDRLEAGLLGRPQAPQPEHEDVPLAAGPHAERLQDAVLLDRRRQFVEGWPIVDLPRIQPQSAFRRYRRRAATPPPVATRASQSVAGSAPRGA